MRLSAGRLLLLALGLACFAPRPATAQSCFAMQAEMMQLKARGAGSGGGNERGRYERAYREQAQVLARTEAQARDAGCFGSGFFLFRRPPERACNALLPKLREMKDNLVRLDSLRRRGGGGGFGDRDDAYRLRELAGMMRARGCHIPGGDAGGDRNRVETRPDDGGYYRQDPRGYGTYRTLCVRTCDGYYFPISFSTSAERLPADAQTCQAMCPGAEAKLFYYDNPGGAPETMVALDGTPYTSLPTAFQYRTSLNPACTCRPAGGTSVAGAPMSTAPATAVDLTAPAPRARPAIGEDPETVADRFGGLTPGSAQAASPSAASGSEVGRHGIRVVGPPLGNTEQDALVISPVPN